MAFGQQGAGFRNPENIIADQVILEGPNNSLLAYNPSQGFGNLTGSFSPNTTFLDSAGNRVLAGIWEYVNLGFAWLAVGLTTAGLQFQTATGPGGPYSNAGALTLTATPGTLELTAVTELIIDPNTFFDNAVNVAGALAANGGLTGTSVAVSGSGTFGGIGQFSGLLTLLAGCNITGALQVSGLTLAGGGVVAQQPGQPYPSDEVWHTPSLGTGWAQGPFSGGGQSVRYRLNANGNIEIIGSFHSTTGTPTATVFTLPTGWQPIANQNVGAVKNLGGTITAININISTAGAVVPGPAIAAADTDVYLDIVIPTS